MGRNRNISGSLETRTTWKNPGTTSVETALAGASRRGERRGRQSYPLSSYKEREGTYPEMGRYSSMYEHYEVPPKRPPRTKKKRQTFPTDSAILFDKPDESYLPEENKPKLTQWWGRKGEERGEGGDKCSPDSPFLDVEEGECFTDKGRGEDEGDGVLMDSPCPTRKGGGEGQGKRNLRQEFFRKTRRKRKRCLPGVEILPSILEICESTEGNEQDISDLKQSLEELNRLTLDILETRQTVNMIQKPPRTFQHYKRRNEEEEESRGEEGREDGGEEKERNGVEGEDVVDACDSETGEVEPGGGAEGDCGVGVGEIEGVGLLQKCIGSTDAASRPHALYTALISTNPSFKPPRSLSSCYFYFSQVLPHSFTTSWLTEPLLLPSALLLFSLQFSLLGFLTLTPSLIYQVVEDSTLEDASFSVCLMGFTWFSFVIVSPCFSTVHFSNHHLICLVALCMASFSSYMLSVSLEADEVALYCCLYGVFQGIAQMTSHSVLKLSLGTSGTKRLAIPLSIIVSLLMLSCLAAFGSLSWFTNLRNSFKFFAILLAMSCLVWAVQGFISTVRRRYNGVTWSRRRRVS